MISFDIGSNYGYVLLAATSTFVINTIHSFNTGSYRRAAGIEYPAAYAPSSRTDQAAHRFNSAQRAHANFIENQPTVLGAMLIAGFKFPLATASLGGLWSLFRLIYMWGYSQGQPGGKGRYKGIAFFLFQYGLIGLAGYTSISMILGS
ncbi:Microsomal glutathione S-transferase 3 [Erysiphe neolycopersici]|uniref:Microsomal glutathione S-transferase 3 n=1 Tax=Erysiphe neolycopersici TaxID=212602 RepID=A0A420HU04_9PEZI|nr:Microsomal glutathione S-transferase 3 [Erysiphe neolycopersici]